MQLFLNAHKYILNPLSIVQTRTYVFCRWGLAELSTSRQVREVMPEINILAGHGELVFGVLAEKREGWIP